MKAPAAVMLLLAVSFPGCDSADDEQPRAANPICRDAQSPVNLPPEIAEASGAAASRAQPGIIWSHNDSGNDPLLFAVDAAGNLVSQIDLSEAGVANEDWEDIALGSCAGGDCLYVGDIGDNQADRGEIVIQRLPEPGPEAAAALEVESFRARYPDGPRDAEGLFILPPDRIFIVTKGGEAAIGVYSYPAPLRSGESVQLELVRTLSVGPVPLGDQVTGASASQNGEWVAIRTYTSLLVYRADQLLEGSDEPSIHVDLKPLSEAQGEGVALGPEGSVVLTSEGASGGLPGALSIIWCADLAR